MQKNLEISKNYCIFAAENLSKMTRFVFNLLAIRFENLSKITCKSTK